MMAPSLPSICLVPAVCTADELAGILRVRPSVIPELDRMGVLVRAARPGHYMARASHHRFIKAITAVVGRRDAVILRHALSQTLQFVASPREKEVEHG